MKRRWIIVGLCTVVVAFAAAWPWSAPKIDWTPLATKALSENRCDTVESILFRAEDAWAIDAYRFRAHMAQAGLCAQRDAQQSKALLEKAERLDRTRLHDLDSGGEWFNFQTYDEDQGLPTLAGTDLMLAYLVDFYCVAPYNKWQGVDYAKLATGLRSDGIPFDTGPLTEFQIRRRSVCSAVVIGFAAHLLRQQTRSTARTVFELLSQPITGNEVVADLMFAEIVLERGICPVSDILSDTERAKERDNLRDEAWRRLESAARRNSMAAMQQLMRYSHEGKYGPRNDERAFFWAMRLKRLGIDTSTLIKDNDFDLTPEQRREAIAAEATGASSY